MDKVDFSEIYTNIDILTTQALIVMKFSLKITITYKLFSNLNAIRKILPLNVNKGFIEQLCICS